MLLVSQKLGSSALDMKAALEGTIAEDEVCTAVQLIQFTLSIVLVKTAVECKLS